MEADEGESLSEKRDRKAGSEGSSEHQQTGPNVEGWRARRDRTRASPNPVGEGEGGRERARRSPNTLGWWRAGGKITESK